MYTYKYICIYELMSHGTNSPSLITNAYTHTNTYIQTHINKCIFYIRLYQCFLMQMQQKLRRWEKPKPKQLRQFIREEYKLKSFILRYHTYLDQETYISSLRVSAISLSLFTLSFFLFFFFLSLSHTHIHKHKLQAKGYAEAEVLRAKAEAFREYGEAAVVQMVVDKLPSLAGMYTYALNRVIHLFEIE